MPERVHVPAPCLVTVPDVVPMMEAIDPPWAPPRVKLKVAPVMVPLFVKSIAPVPPTIELAPLKVTRPLTVAAEPELIKAPFVPIPVPLKLNALAVLKPLRSTVNPVFTVTVPVPNAPLVTAPADPVEAIPALTVPPETVVPPW